MSLLSPERLARIAEIGSQIIGHASRLTTASEDYEGNRNLNLSAMGCSHAIDQLLAENKALRQRVSRQANAGRLPLCARCQNGPALCECESEKPSKK